LLVLPSLKTFEAAVAALLEVCFFGAFLCDKALPADVLDVLLVDEMMMMPALSYFDGRLSCFSVNLCPLNSNTVVIVLTSVHSTQT
jgi:hypothetical protein